MKRTYFKNIEFLRFVFAFLIVFHHLSVLKGYFPHFNLHMNFSAMAVDFFFILSGFFLFYTLDTTQSVIEFIGKKVKRLWSVAAFSAVGYLCLWCFNVTPYYHNFYDGLFAFFFMDNIGITLQHCGQSWYVSVLVFVGLFYFYMYKSLSERTANLLIGVLTWFAYTYTINVDNGQIRQHIQMYDHIFCMGLLRGIGGMGVGVFLAQLYRQTKRGQHSQTSYLGTFIEVGLFCWCMYAMYYSPQNIENSMIFIFAFAVLIWLFLTKFGYFSRLFEHHFAEVLGRYAYSIFLSHMLLFWSIAYFLPKSLVVDHNMAFLVLIYTAVIVLGILTYHFIERPDNALFHKLGYCRYYGFVFISMLILSFGVGHYMTHKPIVFGKVYHFSENQTAIAVTGLSSVEKWGSWSDGEKIELSFYVGKRWQSLQLQFELIPFLTPEHQTQIVEVWANEKKLTEWVFKYGEVYPDTSILLNGDLIKEKLVHIVFISKTAISPKELGISEDKRKLSIGFKNMKIIKEERENEKNF